MRNPPYPPVGDISASVGLKVQGMMPEKLTRPWLTLWVRLSVFPIAPWEAPTDLWEKVVGEPPENDQNQPRQRLRVQNGPWRGGVLQLMVSALKVDWIAAAPPTGEGVPNLDDWTVETVVPEFLKVTHRWLTSFDFEINRIGFGLNSLLSSSDRVSAYGLLSQLVPSITVEPEVTTDL